MATTVPMYDVSWFMLSQRLNWGMPLNYIEVAPQEENIRKFLAAINRQVNLEGSPRWPWDMDETFRQTIEHWEESANRLKEPIAKWKRLIEAYPDVKKPLPEQQKISYTRALAVIGNIISENLFTLRPISVASYTQYPRLRTELIPTDMEDLMWILFSKLLTGPQVANRCIREDCKLWFTTPIARAKQRFCSRYCQSSKYAKKRLEARKEGRDAAPVG